MAYQNNYQNNQNHISSSGVRLFSGDTSLRISLYDQTLSLSFCQAVTDPTSGKRTFPKENALNTLLTAERVAALYNIIKHRIYPAIEEHVARSEFIPTNQMATTMVGVEVTEENLVNLVIYANIGEDRRPKSTLKFNFQDVISLNNFNAETGDFTANTENPIKANLVLFMYILKGFLTEFLSAAHHFAKVDDRFAPRNNGGNFNNNIPGTNVASGGSFNTNIPAGTNGVPTNNYSNLNQMFADSPY